MRRFCLGDDVRVANLAASQWQNRVGTIVEIFEHGPYEEGKIVQECAVALDGERRWFMDKHLMRTVPAKLIRFFRTEVSQRWQLDPNDAIIHEWLGYAYEKKQMQKEAIAEWSKGLSLIGTGEDASLLERTYAPPPACSSRSSPAPPRHRRRSGRR